MRIRIVEMPPGEAPPAVRIAWIGVVLPLATGEKGARRLPAWGVVTGPKTFLKGLLALVLRRWHPIDGYAVDAIEAIELLSAQDKGAALWWRTHAQHMLRPGRRFVFHAHVCELLDGGDPQDSTADPSVDEDEPFVRDVHGKPAR